jgi:hypothetical protein
MGTAEGRDGELKTCWTKPLYESSAYGFSILDLSVSGGGRESAGVLWVRVEGEPSSLLLRIDKMGVGTTGVGR